MGIFRRKNKNKVKIEEIKEEKVSIPEKQPAKETEKTKVENIKKTEKQPTKEINKSVKVEKKVEKPAKTDTNHKVQTKDAENTKSKELEHKQTTSKKPIYRVLYDKENRLWLIKKDGAKRTIASYVTKEEVLNRVKELSTSKDMSFVVHKKDGKFQKK